MLTSLKNSGKSKKILNHFDIGILNNIEKFAVKKYSKNLNMPLIAICGSPRTGHTLTYQLMAQFFETFYINNFSYIFYRNPLIGVYLNKLSCKNYRSDFNSKYGFIRGLNGPHQAYLFWNYWFDMYRDERKPRLNKDRLLRLAQILNKIYKDNKKPFCSSWLGISFYLEEIKECFRNYLIVWSRRDLVSTALSLVNFMRESSAFRKINYSSIRPVECDLKNDFKVLSDLEMAAKQVYFINKKISKFEAEEKYNIVRSDYADLCINPKKHLMSLKFAAESIGVNLIIRDKTDIPKRFERDIKKSYDNSEDKIIERIFYQLFEENGSIDVPIKN